LKKSTKNILLVHSSNDLYGASKILITIIEILIKSGHSIHLILPEDGPLNNHKSLINVHLSIINVGVFRKRYLNFFGLFNRAYFIFKSVFKLKKYIKKFNINLVYNNTSTIISPTFAAYLLNIPTIYHLHEIPTGSKIYVRFLTNIFNKFSSKVLAVSNSTSDFWLKNGVNKNKMSVLHNGFDFKFLSKKNLNDKKIVFTNISRIIPYKGHLFLIELFKKIFEFRDDIILQIVGDTLPAYNNYFEKLKSIAIKEKINKKIIFLGFKNNIKSILNKTNFFIHTPIHPDPFPTVIFEAIESGTPVVFTNKGGAKEILDDSKNGLQIDFDNIEKSTQSILNYINDKDQQLNNIEDSIKFVSKNFNKDIFSKKLILLISSM
tara:strand:+ start:731 stop:1861 length:1131 start_codon:yes stop_codon:yes gene_type:complete